MRRGSRSRRVTALGSTRAAVLAVALATALSTVLTAGVAQAAPTPPVPVPPVPAPPAGLGGPPGPLPALPLPGSPATPDRDPFYRAPDHLADRAPGEVLRARPVAALSPTALTGFRAYQLLYRTTGVHGEPLATVATMLIPNVPAPGPRRLVSYHTAEDSFTTRCAPSYTLRTASGGTQQLESGMIASLLGRGWDVVVPDYEGPHSLYPVGPMAGRAALDGVRAAERFGPAGLQGRRTEVGMIGYSGGSIPTTWADAMARDYAPELNLVGVAAGGVAANLREALPPLEGAAAFGAVLVATIGLDRAYPGLDLRSRLNGTGRTVAAGIGRDAYGCGGGLTVAPGGRVAQYTRFRSVGEMLADPQVTEALARVNLNTRPRFAAPAYIYHEAHDEILTVKQADELVATQCRRGATIQYHRNPVGGHISGALAYLAPATQYLADRFAGRPAPSTCH
jgi:hypothetical protein